jgi:hypothetical protein
MRLGKMLLKERVDIRLTFTRMSSWFERMILFLVKYDSWMFIPGWRAVAFNEDVAKVSVPSNTPVAKIDDLLSVRWGVRV